MICKVQSIPLHVVCASAALAFVSCGGERVSAREQRSLPTHQYALAQDVCPENGEPSPATRRLRRVGERRLRALERAHRAHPDAIVTTTVTPESGPVEREEITISELARTHLEGAEGADTPCYSRLEERLRELVDG